MASQRDGKNTKPSAEWFDHLHAKRLSNVGPIKFIIYMFLLMALIKGLKFGLGLLSGLYGDLSNWFISLARRPANTLFTDLRKGFFENFSQFWSIGLTLISILTAVAASYLFFKKLQQRKIVIKLSDRLVSAIAQLEAMVTDDKCDIKTSMLDITTRIEAIQSIARIAKEGAAFDKGRLHISAMEALCSYVRKNAPNSIAQGSLHAKYERQLNDEGYFIRVLFKDDFLTKESGRLVGHFGDDVSEFSEDFAVGQLDAPRADIAATLRAIGLRDLQQLIVEARWGDDAQPTDVCVFDVACPALLDGPEATSAEELEVYSEDLQAWREGISRYRGFRIDLRNTCLQCAEMSGLNLSGADFRGARMEGANLSGSRLVAANLSGAHMSSASLYFSVMDGAELGNAQIQRAEMRNSQMKGANLQGACLEEATVNSARLDGANLSQAQLSSANFGWAHLKGVDLFEAQMEETQFFAAQMQGVDLNRGCLLRANLKRARLDGAYFIGCQMDAETDFGGALVTKAYAKSANFSKASISPTQLETMFGDASVTLPNGITPTHPDWPAHWPKAVLEWDDFDAAYTSWLATQP